MILLIILHSPENKILFSIFSTDTVRRFIKPTNPINTNGTEPQTEEKYLPETTGTPYHGMKMTRKTLLLNIRAGFL